jgi:hypothetical protein
MEKGVEKMDCKLHGTVNSAKLLICALLCAACAFAQEQQADYPFDKLHGFAYYSTLGGAPTIENLIATPSDFHGYKFVYISPVGYSGYSAFDFAGGSMLLGFDNSLILGYARGSWGLSLDLALNKTWYKVYDGYERYTHPGDNIGANFSVPLGNLTLYTRANWLNKDYDATNSYSLTCEENINCDMQEESSVKKTSIGITGGNKFIWDAGFDFSKNKGTIVISNEKYNFNYFSYDFTITGANLHFDLGYKALQNNRARFIVGLNNNLNWEFQKYKISSDFYDNTGKYSNHSLWLSIQPNILGEVALTGHLFAFAGAWHNIAFNMLLEESYFYEMDIMLINLNTVGSRAYLGLRYERENWTVETRLQNDVFEEIFNKKSPFINLSGFIFF